MDKIDTPVELPNPEILADTKLRASWIIYQLKLRGSSIAAVGRQYGAARNCPGNALRRPWPVWEYRIAKALGREPQDIFPERYRPDGLPINSRGLPKESDKAMAKASS